MTERRKLWTTVWLLQYRRPNGVDRWTTLSFRTLREASTYIRHELPLYMTYSLRRFIPA